jgi:hypothetical protein
VATTFQWRRCDSVGANCTDITGATSSTYTTTATDAGASIRVVADGVTSGPWNVSTVPATPFWQDNFDSRTLGTNLVPPGSPWSGSVRSPTTNTATVATDPLGQRSKVAKFTLFDGPDYADWLWFYVDPAICHGRNGYETWAKFSIMIPTGFVPSSGGFNWFSQWHNSPTSPYVATSDAEPTANTAMQLKLSGGVEIFENYWAGGTAQTRAIAESHRVFYNTSAFTVANKIVRDTWIDFVEHIKWSPTSTGRGEMWTRAGGGAWTKWVDYSGPTLYQPYWNYPSGSSFYTNETVRYLGYYRANGPTFSSDWYVDDVMFGDSVPSSIGFVVP